MPLSPGTRVDRYEVVSLLGTGGMGEVYEARDPKLERLVALKILRGDSAAAGGGARLLREARAVAALSHPNVLVVHDVGEVHEPEELRGLGYIAMERVIGRSLRAYVGDETVPMDRRIGWIVDTARALAAAHEVGLVHRDVKPENVMVGVDGVVKVLDFGLARRGGAAALASAWNAAQSEIARRPGEDAARLPRGFAREHAPARDLGRLEATFASQALVGTPFYMAPEQLRGESQDGRSDQFSWGVLAYELLTGVAPWRKEEGVAVAVSEILSLEPRPPSEVDPTVPIAVSGAIMRALSKRAMDRYASMRELIDRLVESLNVVAFEDERRQRSLIPVRVACVLGICAFVAFAFVDPYVVRHSVANLLVARAVIVATISVVLGASFTDAGARRVAYLAVLACLAIGGGVIVVTVLSGGAESRYHEALLLTFLGFAVLIPWPPVTASITFGALIAIYDAALLAFGCAKPTGVWVSNNFVLWSGVAIAVIGVTVADNLRRVDFWNRARLKKATDDLSGLDRAKSRFFANLSHKLRTPLTMIHAPLEAVLDGASGITSAHREQLELSRRNVLRLLHVVDDLVELSRLEAAALRLRLGPVDLGRLAREVRRHAEPLAERKEIAVRAIVSPEGDHVVQADEAQLERVLLNLVSNALEFTEEGGSISVLVCEANAHDGDGVRVSVRDTGIGIPPEALPRVFDRFWQVSGSGTRRGGGMGIGLALARELVTLHGGKIEAESELGEGTTVSFWLPRVPAVPAHGIENRRSETVVPRDRRSPAPTGGGLLEWQEAIRTRDEYRLMPLTDATDRRGASRVRGAGTRPLVLVVVDNPDMVTLLVAMLMAEYDVVTAAGGEEGLVLAQRWSPAAIVSDLRMPKMDGLALVRALRADPTTARTPIVLLTAHGQRDVRLAAAEGGADAYLTKPFRPRELYATLASLLRTDAPLVREAP